jgi:hypothetical protein
MADRVAPCLIVNPRSFQATRSGFLDRVARLAKRYGAPIVTLTDPTQLLRELDRLCAEGRQRLFVLSGDGTVQGIVQYLALLPANVWNPELLILGGGRSNATANDFGGGSALSKLEAALHQTHNGEAMHVAERQLLRVEQEGAVAQHGFLLAGSMIDAAIRLCHAHRQAGTGWLHRGVLSSQYRLAKLVGEVALKRSPLPPYPQLDIRADGETLSGANRLLIATTLLHRDSLYNPYAARGTGAVRMTAISADAQRFWSRLPRLLTGYFSDDMNPQHGYLSGRFERVEISGLASYALDGELFACDPARPVVLQGGPHVRVLLP